jgi:penicillin amidase
MRWIGRVFVTLLLLVAVAALVAWLLLAGSRPQLDGMIALRGLSAPVTITRDVRGTPTIEARDRADAAYALGFVHGQERFSRWICCGATRPVNCPGWSARPR